MLRRVLAVVAFGLVLGLLPAPRAEAAIGLRTGFSLTPDQVVLGFHHRFDKTFIPATQFLLPVVELGFGDSVTKVSLATDLVARLPHIDAWQFYAGGELAYDMFFSDGGNENDNDLGFAGLIGIDRPVTDSATVGFEFKLFFIDNPDVEFLFTYTFGSTVKAEK